ncbi:MAG: GNAT family N-acetyltransferase [Lachnospiraceae bacterium]|nr:GNAT family N-acetyltransferase [Lachnospiraceae bacterium]
MMYDRMDNDNSPNFITGEKIILRPLDLGDTELIVNWRNQPFIMDKMICRDPFTITGHEEWVKTMIGTGKVVQFIILEKECLRPIGSTFLRDINYDYEKAEYGIFIGERDAAGRGYGTEAAKLMIDYAFEMLNLHKVFLRFISTNIAAEKSYIKAGFVREAYLKDEIKVAGEFMDVILMSKIRS